MASRALVKLLLPPSSTFSPGMNMREEGLGVCCVWMNMPRRGAAGWRAVGTGSGCEAVGSRPDPAPIHGVGRAH